MKTISIKWPLVVFLSLTCLAVIPFIAKAATITTCTFDKSAYDTGETGYVTVTVYNDKDDKIRITELTANIDYYYDGGNVYVQTFYTSTDLPTEIQKGESDNFLISFSLPNNIAHGYTEVLVKAKTQLWNNHSQTWFASENPTYRPTLYIESPYKQQFEDQQTINNQLQEQIQDLKVANSTTTSVMYLFIITTMIFAVVTVALIIFNKKARAMAPAAG